MEQFDYWKLLAGLGIFLFGMFAMEESTRLLAGRSFKKAVRIFTTGKFKSILTGTFVTSILQSSSAVSLMVLTFVGAGIIPMENAIGVILGSNVGTTFTGWIVAFFGFKLNIESFSLPLIGIGGLGIIFLGKSERYSNLSKLVVGFGFLFMGLSYMKESVTSLQNNLNLDAIKDYNIFVFALASIIITAIMQSSSASLAIILTALNANMILFDSAAAMVIGANVGTTTTILLGAIQGSTSKKRVAISHLIFNVVTAIIGFIVLYGLIWIIKQLIDIETNSVIALALFHTLFNIMGVCLFIPFIGKFAKLLHKIVPNKHTKHAKFIQNDDTEIAEAALTNLKHETIHLLHLVMVHNAKIVGINTVLLERGLAPDLQSKTNDELYISIKELQVEIYKYAIKVQSWNLEDEESKTLSHLIHASRQLLLAAKTIRDIEHDLTDYKNEDNDYLNNESLLFKERLAEFYIPIIETGFDDTNQLIKILTDALIEIKKDDHQFMNDYSKAVSDKKVKGLYISTVLITNRSFVLSARQLIYAIREFVLSEEEQINFDKKLAHDSNN